MNDIYSFYKLISEFKIEIPVIQRDYAQGRSDSKATDVRKSIVEKILESVTMDKPLFFDFVYGRIEGDTFIPFDGQQRLTTLFLFHRYIFEKCKCKSDCAYVKNCQCLSLLSRFTYTTRQSSREFCEQLINNTIIPPCIFVDSCSTKSDCVNSSISEYIKDQSWFYPHWSKDPTINGMLAMLDEIDLQCKRIGNFKDVAQKLTSGCVCPITFHFVNMGEHKMFDSTYIKMNARGKSLTSFENFKASLEEYLSSQKLNDLKDRFVGNIDGNVSNIDGKWLDLFYNETKPSVPDLTMLSFFKRHFLNFYVVNGGKEKEIVEKLERQITAEDFIPFAVFKEVLKGNESAVLTPLFNLLDVLVSDYDNVMVNSLPVWYRDDYKKNIAAFTSDKEKEKYYTYFRILFKGNWNKKGQKSQDEETAGSERYQSRVIFYAVVKYFERIKQFNSDQFAQWMRVIWNYTENVQFDTFDDYYKDLVLVDRISSCLTAVTGFYAALAISTEKGRQSRMEEELIKANLISSDPTKWENRINELEKHKYFTGEIKFMFDFLGSNPIESLFDSYSTIMRELFDANGLNSKYDENGEYRFRRTLMYFSSSSSYAYNKNQNLSFLKNNDRDISWKRFISDSKSIKEGIPIPNNEVLHSLIRGLHIQRNNGKTYYQAFDYYLSYALNVWNWRYCFIAKEKIWEYMSDDKFIRKDSAHEIYLMKTTRMSGTHAELKTYCLFLNSNIQSVNNWDKKYYDVAGREEQPCLFFRKAVGTDTFVIDIYWDIDNGQGYYLNLFTRDGCNTNVTPIVSANTQWGLTLSNPTNPNSRYSLGFLTETDIIILATDIMNAI